MKSLLLSLFILLIFGPCAIAQSISNDSLARNILQESEKILSDTSTIEILTKLSKATEAITTINIMLDKGFNTQSIEDGVKDIDTRLAYADSLINGLEDHLSYRLLKSQSIFLDQIKINLDGYNRQLSKFNEDITKVQKDILHFVSDPSFKINPTDSVLRKEFADDYKKILDKWLKANAANKEKSLQIARIESKITVDYMKWSALSEDVKIRLEHFNENIFRSSNKPLLQAKRSDYSQDLLDVTERSAKSGSTVLLYYLKTHWVADFITVFLTIWFLAWILFIKKQFRKNIMSYMRNMGVRLKYLTNNPVYATLLLALSIAPFFFPNPPVIFDELIWSLLGLVLTALFFKDKRIAWRIRILWAVFFISFRLVALLNLYLYTSYEERWLLLVLNVVLIVISCMQYITNKKALLFNKNRTLFLSMLLVTLHIGAIVCNFIGLFNLAKILTASATFGLFTAIVLSVFIDVTKEALSFQLAHLKMIFLNIHEKTFLRLYQIISSALSTFSIIAWVVIFLQSLNIFSYLKDIITNFLNNPITVGSTSFTIGGVLLYLIIIWVSVVISNLISILTDLTTTKNKKYFRLNDIKLFLKLGVITGGVLLAFMATGMPIDKLAIVLGALGVGISFGLQHLVSNLVAGLMISMERPVRIGDTIEVGEHKGIVKEIGIRSIHIISSNGSEIIIPNGDLLVRHVVNWTLSDKNKRMSTTVLVKYENDLHAVKALIKEALYNEPFIMKNPEPQVLTTDIANGSIEINCYFWCNDVSKGDSIKGRVLENIHDIFKQHSITLQEYFDPNQANR
jgi:small-conductance mechanosensitive channel